MYRESCAKETCQDISQWFGLLFRNGRNVSHEVVSQISCKLAPIQKRTFDSSRLQHSLLQTYISPVLDSMMAQKERKHVADKNNI